MHVERTTFIKSARENDWRVQTHLAVCPSRVRNPYHSSLTSRCHDPLSLIGIPSFLFSMYPLPAALSNSRHLPAFESLLTLAAPSPPILEIFPQGFTA